MKTKTTIQFVKTAAAFALATFALLVNGCQSSQTAGNVSPTTSAMTASTAAPGKITLKLASVDSEEISGEDGAGANAVDGDSNTFWHTQWEDSPLPHEIVIELIPPSVIKGFTYLPRQDGNDHGIIKDYEFYVSNDGKDFGQPVVKGTFEPNSDKKTVTFAPVKCRFIKLKALSEINGEEWTSAAEIGVIPND